MGARQVSDISDRYQRGETVDNNARAYGLKKSIIRARLRAMKIDIEGEIPSVWDLDQDEQRAEFARRARRAAGMRMRELGIERLRA
jgi:hypothetical protein